MKTRVTNVFPGMGTKSRRGSRRRRRKYIEHLFQVVDKVIVPSVYVRDVLMSLYPAVSHDKSVVIELGVDKELLRDNNGKPAGRKNGSLHLAFLGNFLHYKGNKTFLQLMKYFKNSDTVRFSIIGNIFDPSLLPSNKNLNIAGGYTRDKDRKNDKRDFA